MSVAESVIVCEGYLDRAFWHGLLMYRFGCRDQRKDGPWGKVSGAGIYGMTSPTGRALRIVPANARPSGGTSRNPVFQAAELLLKGHETRPVEQLILNIDADTEGVESEVARNYPAQLLHFVQELVDGATSESDGSVHVDNGPSRIGLIPWRVDRITEPPVPQKNTLERVVMAALGCVYPERAGNVALWLRTRVDLPKPSPKEATWSFMAGWHAELGCEGFFKEVWRDSSVAIELQKILEEIGAWETIVRFAA